ncbi:helix-turn-helix transcriptional regulator [Oceanospirillum sp. D5]|uniref:Helix-turn-helix transcriptional regulator n=1 Tax=Oceanospirillum sediminis TaxID=2760088 RepID=A0A839INM7_9GAMM|nr:helix-turn-helix transcriptional regulator [Oceanospirillum sediminis]
MKEVQIKPAWTFCDERGRQLEPQLFNLLRGVHEFGKLTAAAKQVGISYRHAWNLLNKWTDFFGAELVILQKGKGAWLSPLGEKLLWAEQRVSARLEPQLKNLASELNLEIRKTLEENNPVIRIHASHGYAVALLPEHNDGFQIDLQYMSAVDALASLGRGQCDIAGFHLPVKHLSEALFHTYSQFIKKDHYQVIRFITRQQGLIVAAGNPLGIKGFQDLIREDVTFINREKGSGSRALLDELLCRSAISPEQINGFNAEEFTHSAIAAYVAAGMADTGFGVEAAAARFGLDFIPVEQENYLLVCHQDFLQGLAMERFQAMLAHADFIAAIEALPGYRAEGCGDVIDIDTLWASSDRQASKVV